LPFASQNKKNSKKTEQKKRKINSQKHFTNGGNNAIIVQWSTKPSTNKALKHVLNK